MRYLKRKIFEISAKYANRGKAPFKISYAQCGEDLIIDYVMRILNINIPVYIDVGAYDPIILSNTYLFYQRGSSGICVEPNLALCDKIATIRPRDKCMNVGVSGKSGDSLDFFVMHPPTLSTFNRNEAERTATFEGHKIVERRRVSVESLNDIIDDGLDAPPDIISLDVEGDDMAILEKFEFDRCRPPLWCVETVRYDPNRGTKDLRFKELMEDNGYFCYSDTFVNSIFVDKHRWSSGLSP